MKTDRAFTPVRKLVACAACAVILCCVLSSIAFAAPVSLLLPQSTAFSILGHSCGGIQEQAFATGFTSTKGYPRGDVYVQTRCGGSGRGGGYHVTTYSAWVRMIWDFSGNVVSWTKLAAAPTVDPAFSETDANGNRVYNTGTAAYLAVPAPAAPTGVIAVQSGDEFQVSWNPAPGNPAVITSSTITAAPVNSTAPTITTNLTGSTKSGLVGPLQSQTVYRILVVNSTIGGSSPPSNPIKVTTQAASVVPSAPTGVTAVWASNNTLLARWNAANPGNSPIDQHEVTVTESDEGGGTFTQSVPGTTLTATFNVSDVPDWTVKVRAHNAAGWGPWSTPFTLGGL
jgi:hypothetical protein